MTKISKKMGQCTLACGDDTSCLGGCQYTFQNDHKNCPCQVRSLYSRIRAFKLCSRKIVHWAALVIATPVRYKKPILSWH